MLKLLRGNIQNCLENTGCHLVCDSHFTRITEMFVRCWYLCLEDETVFKESFLIRDTLALFLKPSTQGQSLHPCCQFSSLVSTVVLGLSWNFRRHLYLFRLFHITQVPFFNYMSTWHKSHFLNYMPMIG